MAKTTNPLMSATASGTFGKMTTYREMGGRGIASMHRRAPTIDNSPTAIRRRALFAVKRATIQLIEAEANRGGWIDNEDGELRDLPTLMAKYVGENWRDRFLGNEADQSISDAINGRSIFPEVDPSRLVWQPNAPNPRIARAPTAKQFEWRQSDTSETKIIVSRWKAIDAIMSAAFGSFGTSQSVTAPVGTDPMNSSNTLGVFGINESSRRSAAFRF